MEESPDETENGYIFVSGESADSDSFSGHGHGEVKPPGDCPEPTAGGSVPRVGSVYEDRPGTGQVYVESQYTEFVARRYEQGDNPSETADQSKDPDARAGSGEVNPPSQFDESVASRSEQQENPSETADQSEDPRARAGSGEVYAPSQFAESVASISEQGDNPSETADQSEDTDASAGSGEIYAPSQFAESVASRSEQGDNPSETADQSEDPDARAGSGEIYAPSQFAESVAYRSEQGENPSETADRCEDPDARAGSGEVYAPSQFAESVASRSEQGENPSETADRSEDPAARAESGEVYTPSQLSDHDADASVVLTAQPWRRVLDVGLPFRTRSGARLDFLDLSSSTPGPVFIEPAAHGIARLGPWTTSDQPRSSDNKSRDVTERAYHRQRSANSDRDFEDSDSDAGAGAVSRHPNVPVRVPSVPKPKRSRAFVRSLIQEVTGSSEIYHRGVRARELHLQLQRYVLDHIPEAKRWYDTDPLVEHLNKVIVDGFRRYERRALVEGWTLSSFIADADTLPNLLPTHLRANIADLFGSVDNFLLDLSIFVGSYEQQRQSEISEAGVPESERQAEKKEKKQAKTSKLKSSQVFTTLASLSPPPTSPFSEAESHHLRQQLRRYVRVCLPDSGLPIDMDRIDLDLLVDELHDEIFRNRGFVSIEGVFLQDWTESPFIEYAAAALHISGPIRAELDSLFGSAEQFLQGLSRCLRTGEVQCQRGMYYGGMVAETPIFEEEHYTVVSRLREPAYRLVHAIQTEARALDSRDGHLLYVSPTGLLTTYECGVWRSIPQHFVQLRMPSSLPYIRIDSSLSSLRGYAIHVVASNQDVELFDRTGYGICSERTDQFILDVSADSTDRTVYALTMTDIRTYRFEDNTLCPIHTAPLQRADLGRIARSRNYLYVTRENEGLVKRMDIRTNEITEVISGLVRPTAISADSTSSILAVADDHNVNIYSTDTHDLITTIPVGSAIIDVEIIGDRIFVLTGRKIEVYYMPRR